MPLVRSALLVAVVTCANLCVAADVKVGVLGLFHPKHLQVRSVGSSWAVVSGCGERIALDPAGPSASADFAIEAAHTSMIVGRSIYHCSSFTIAARDGSAVDFEIAVPGKIHRRYRGMGEVAAVGSELQATVSMDLESAVASVVAAESAADTPIEALKAQAVAARSFLIARGSGHANFDFCDTTHCQFLREIPPRESSASKATIATKGLVLMYSGRAVSAMYSASCGGRTRTLRDVGVETQAYPYFEVDCPYCRRTAAQWRRLGDHAVESHSERERIRVGRTNGWSAIPGNNFRVLRQGDATILEGRGAGHGVGLCQEGAKAMAREGANFESILAHYYPNTTLGTDQTPGR